ncbi:hypothetical protein [Sessilibacter sp. MAH4]
MTKVTIFGKQYNDDSPNLYDKEVQIESDVIVSAVILGFSMTRFYQQQHCQFDIEHPNASDVGSPEKEDKIIQDWHKFETVLSAMSAALDRYCEGSGDWLKDGQSPKGAEGELITGRSGGHRQNPTERESPLTYSKAAMLNNAERNKDSVYSGRGAYTGLVDNPEKADNNLYPTMRVEVNKTERPWPGKHDEYWGLIAPTGNEQINLDPNPAKGMGPMPQNTPRDVKVGYMHGMCTAITHCEQQGPWCTPYEMATGLQTTKMASCFPCTTYMYSSGYVPSSIHLGRGESWVPPRSGQRLEVNRYSNSQPVEPLNTNCDENICGNLSESWHRSIYHLLVLGSEIICNARASEFFETVHINRAYELSEQLEKYSSKEQSATLDINTQGGAFFLDALSVHDSELNRLQRTLEPACKTYEFMERYVFRTKENVPSKENAPPKEANHD